MSSFETRLGRLRVLWPPEPPAPEPEADLTNLTEAELIELEIILRHALPGDLSGLTDDELDRLKELQTIAWGP